MKGGEGGDAIGERAAGVVEIKDRGGYVFRPSVSRNPPAVELGKSGISDVEVNFLERQAGGAWGCGDGPRGMEEHLPLALVEEEAQGGVSTEGGGQEGKGESCEEPARADID